MSPSRTVDEDAFPRIDQLFDVLSKRPRRFVLLGLVRDEVESLSDLLPRAAEGTAELELRHVHLPKLDHAGYVEWDQETGRIARGPQFYEIEPVLDALADDIDEGPSSTRS